MKVPCLYRTARAVLVVTLGMALTACATARVGQFDAFARAGIQFTDAVQPVVDEAFETAVATDTLMLLEARGSLSDTMERLKYLQRSDEDLGQRLKILNDLKRHAALLKSYFIALRALAQTDEASGMTTATRDLVGNMRTLNGQITDAEGSRVDEFLGQGVSIAVSTFQSAALNRELQANAAVIERELDLQQAVLAAIGDDMRADLEAQLTAQYRDRVELPYARDDSVPSDWNRRRIEAFRRRARLTSLDAAAAAARSLRVAYVALVENRLDSTGIGLLVDDIQRIITLAEGVADLNTGGAP